MPRRFPFPVLALALVAMLAALVPASPAGAQATDPPAPEVAAGTLTPLLAGPSIGHSEVPPAVQPGEVGTEAVTFVVNYDANFNANPSAKAAFQYAVSLWSQLITSAVPITINAQFTPLGTNVLGQSGPDSFVNIFPNQPVANTWYPAALANALAGSDQAAGSDATLDMSSNFSNWYFGTDGATPGSSYDFVSVVMHELGHSIGFIGSANVSGSNGTIGCCSPSHPMIYDRFVQNGAAQPLVGGPFVSGTPAMKAQLVGGDLHFVGPTSNGVLFAPNPWQSGSSYSHLDEATYPAGNPNSLMTPVLHAGESIHAPGLALNMLHDTGWPLPTAPVTAPQGVSPVAGSGSAVVSFLPPANDGGSAPTLYTVTATPGGATSTGTRSPVGIAGLSNGTSYTFTVKATNFFGTGPDSAASGAVVPHRFGYVPLAPLRILDTRVGGLGNPRTTPLSPGEIFPVNITGQAGAPPDDADAVVVNVTAVTPSAAGWLTIWDTGGAPLAANLNFAPGQTVANLVTVKLKSPGSPETVQLGNTVSSASAGFTHVVMDVVGYYADAASPINTDANDPITSITPTRLMDTRLGTGNPACTTCTDPKNTPLGPSAVYDVQIANTASVPNGATGAVINVTAVSPTSGGWLTIYPAGSSPSPPTAANLNFTAGQTVANLVKVKLGTGGSLGKVSVANSFGSPSAGSVNVIFDVVGWFGSAATDGGVTTVTPARILDTRGGATGANLRGTALGPQEQTSFQVGGFGDVPASGASAVILNVTVVAPTAGGWLTLWPDNAARPTAANVSFSAGQTIAILVVVKLAPNGKVDIGNTVGNAGAGFANVVVDVAGWYAPGT